MATVNSLPGIGVTEADRLKSAGYSDVDRLWQAVEHGGLDAVGAKAGLTPARLAAILGAFEVREVRRARKPWRDHVSGLALQLVSVVLIAAIIVGVHYVVLGSVRRLSSANRVTTYAVVGAPGGLPAYSIVRADQVKILTGPATDQDLADPASVVGKYTLEALPAGAAIRRPHLGNRLPLDALKARTIVSLNVNSGSLPEVSLPRPVTLLFSPLLATGPAQGTPELVDALLLNVRRTADRVTVDVAVMQMDLPRIARVAGQSLMVIATQNSTGDTNEDRPDRQ